MKAADSAANRRQGDAMSQYLLLMYQPAGPEPDRRGDPRGMAPVGEVRRGDQGRGRLPRQQRPREDRLGDDRPRPRRRDPGHRRPLRRDQGVPRRLLPGRGERPRRRARVGGQDPECRLRIGRGAADVGRLVAIDDAADSRRPRVSRRAGRGARNPDPAPRRLPARRGCRSGRLRLGRRDVAPRRGPRQPRCLDHGDGAAQGDRPPATRARDAPTGPPGSPSSRASTRRSIAPTRRRAPSRTTGSG